MTDTWPAFVKNKNKKQSSIEKKKKANNKLCSVLLLEPPSTIISYIYSAQEIDFTIFYQIISRVHSICTVYWDTKSNKTQNSKPRSFTNPTLLNNSEKNKPNKGAKEEEKTTLS
jgi:hypothetical protein